MLAKRYAPFAAVVLAQLVVVVLAPSRAPDRPDAFAAGASSYVAPGAVGAADGAVPVAGGAPVDPASAAGSGEAAPS
ncbi:MAG: hypothetical protein JWM64_2149, partial [Frankiales bacterium]|nr:hypothetical protein [Frankiales bacterium]